MVHHAQRCSAWMFGVFGRSAGFTLRVVNHFTIKLRLHHRVALLSEFVATSVNQQEVPTTAKKRNKRNSANGKHIGREPAINGHLQSTNTERMPIARVIKLDATECCKFDSVNFSRCQFGASAILVILMAFVIAKLFFLVLVSARFALDVRTHAHTVSACKNSSPRQ